jgi:hypothetical protein
MMKAPWYIQYIVRTDTCPGIAIRHTTCGTSTTFWYSSTCVFTYLAYTVYAVRVRTHVLRGARVPPSFSSARNSSAVPTCRCDAHRMWLLTCLRSRLLVYVFGYLSMCCLTVCLTVCLPDAQTDPSYPVCLSVAFVRGGAEALCQVLARGAMVVLVLWPDRGSSVAHLPVGASFRFFDRAVGALLLPRRPVSSQSSRRSIKKAGWLRERAQRRCWWATSKAPARAPRSPSTPSSPAPTLRGCHWLRCTGCRPCR